MTRPIKDKRNYPNEVKKKTISNRQNRKIWDLSEERHVLLRVDHTRVSLTIYIERQEQVPNQTIPNGTIEYQ